MKFGVFVGNIFFCQFWPILTPLVLKVKNFAQNKSSRAEKLATSLFLYEESEKIGPETICQPPIFQLGRFLLTLSLKLISSEILSVITYKSNFFLNSPTELYERILVYYVTDPVYLEKFEKFLKKIFCFERFWSTPWINIGIVFLTRFLQKKFPFLKV